MIRSTRRVFLSGAATTAAAGLVGCSETSEGEDVLANSTQVLRGFVSSSSVTANDTTARLLGEDAPAVPVFAYDGNVPGRGIRVTQGARVRRRFNNRLPEPSTIHWHGLRLPNRMDGVPLMTQEPVAPGSSFTYEFVARDAGTFWYHSHFKSLDQLSLGMAAPLIVRETEPPDTDADLSFMLNEWRLDASGNIIVGDSAPVDQRFFTINGQRPLVWRTRKNERLRVRLINATMGRTMTLSWAGLSAWRIALDGMPLAAPQRATRTVLGPGQRVDLMVDITAETGTQAEIRGGGQVLAAFPVRDGGASTARPAPTALPPNDLPALNLGQARRITWVMKGGSLGTLQNGRVRDLGLVSRQKLVELGMAWSINDWCGLPEDFALVASRGETIRLRIVNANPVPHAMHMHGHHFRHLVGGQLGPWHDTSMIDGNQTVELVFNADNPGDWMFHCHMLDHQAQGMATMFQVT